MFLVTTSYLHDKGVNGSLSLWGELDDFLESIQVRFTSSRTEM